MRYGCPVACRYCVISEVAYRRDQWAKRFLVGINKAVTILNPPPDREDKEALQSFYDFDVSLLEGDIVGFNAISDPFWAKYRPELEWFLEHVPPLAKGVTLVTKMPVSRSLMERLAEVKNLSVNVSITGLDMIERTSTASRLRTLALAKEYGVRAFPVIHPYIAGMSDLSFLPSLRGLGYSEVDVKGLRMDASMAAWMPPEISRRYEGTEGKEVLLEDGWREKVEGAGISLKSLRQWTTETFGEKGPHLSASEAESKVRKLFDIANITSSDTDLSVYGSAIQRRL